MAKRKRTDVVKLQLRIREGLRRRLEAAANAEERSLNSEIALRLENSFDQEKNSLILQVLLAPGAGLELVRAVGTILRRAGRDWNTPPKSHAVAEAIRKIVAVLSDELRPDENSFPNRNEEGSADQLAWLAVHTSQIHEMISELENRGFLRRIHRKEIREATDDSHTIGKPAGKMP